MGLLIPLLLLIPFAALRGEEPKAESVCVSCHRELDGPLAAPVGLWETSIHHQMGNNCEGCHGGDPNDAADAMSPEKGFVGAPKKEEIPAFCGKCHVGVLENYKKSPHYAAFRGGTGPSCVTCHQGHDVRKASFNLIREELCSQCHSFDNGQVMRRAFVQAEFAIGEMTKELKRLNHRGMPVKKLEEKLFAERNSFHQMTHTLDLREIGEKTRGVIADLEAMKQETGQLQERVRHRWVIGTAVGIFLIVLIAVLIQLLRTYENED